MTRIIRRSAEEYRRQISEMEAFSRHTGRIAEIIRSLENPQTGAFFSAEERGRALLLLAMPLVDIAWADGKVNGYEQDAILKAADIYGLIEDLPLFSELSGRLGARPTPHDRERFWCEIASLFMSLKESEHRALAFCLGEQAGFVAAQSQRWLLGYWKGLRAGERELEMLRDATKRLEEINFEAERLRKENEAQAGATAIVGENGLNRLVPLIKVAWADGQVTKRERRLVLEVAARNGIKPETDAFKRLESWLELHPTDDFYNQSLKSLRENLQKLPPNEREQQKFDLLGDCADVAAVSGGSAEFRGGGARVSREEIVVVKNIARILNNHRDAGLS